MSDENGSAGGAAMQIAPLPIALANGFANAIQNPQIVFSGMMNVALDRQNALDQVMAELARERQIWMKVKSGEIPLSRLNVSPDGVQVMPEPPKAPKAPAKANA